MLTLLTSSAPTRMGVGGGTCAKSCLKQRRVLGTIIDVSLGSGVRTEFEGGTGAFSEFGKESYQERERPDIRFL